MSTPKILFRKVSGCFLKILLVNLVTNAISELSRPTLPMYKSILWIKMSQEWLNSCTKKWLDDLNFTTIANELSDDNDKKYSALGIFNTQDCMQFHKENALCIYSNIKKEHMLTHNKSDLEMHSCSKQKQHPNYEVSELTVHAKVFQNKSAHRTFFRTNNCPRILWYLILCLVEMSNLSETKASINMSRKRSAIFNTHIYKHIYVLS